MMIGILKRGLTGSLLVCAIVVGLAASSASAASPWWHLASHLRTGSIQPGHAKDEVFELTVEGTEGAYALQGEGEGQEVEGEVVSAVRVGAAATNRELQEKLEEIYGSGNVEVTGGPEENGAHYKIEFINGMADRPVALALRAAAVSRANEEGKVTVKEMTRGASDGVITVTATNVGDADADVEGDPVTLSDVLPQGLTAVAIEGAADEGLQAF